jgi:anti-sigma factor RsiW
VSARACEAIAEDLVAFVDGELPEAERAPVEAHVAGCLACRREIERIAKVSALVAGLPRIEPSAELEERMRWRLAAGASAADAAARTRRRGWRPVFWGVPVLAAAAAIALVWYWSMVRPTPNGLLAPRGRQVAVAPARPDRTEQLAGERETERAVAAAPGLSPEDLPPDLVEHPELFLRYPVVRRLNKLEHFEEVRQHPDIEPLGEIAPPPWPFG